jgi:DNA repair protein SbcC/Rad50
MKILNIQIKNLASIEDAIIDFTVSPLKEAGLFAITGATGSGKSTILDALCLALYDETPRFRQGEKNVKLADASGEMIAQNDIRKILRDGCTSGSAAVSFVGIDGKPYTASWQVRRGRDKISGGLQKIEMQLFDEQSQTFFPAKLTETRNEIERLVGLSYAQFTKSVLLSQGEFSAFLKAPENEKSELLEKLTGSTIYTRIAKQIHEHKKEADAELKILVNSKGNINNLTDEEIEEYQNNKINCINAIKNLQAQQQQTQQSITWHQTSADLQSKQQQALAQLQMNEQQQQLNASLIQELKEHQQVQAIRRQTESLTIKQQFVANKQIELKVLQEKIGLAKQQQETMQQQLQDAEQQLQDAEKAEVAAKPLLDKAKNLEPQIIEFNKQLFAISAEHKDAEKLVAENETKQQALQQHITQLEHSIAELQQWIEAYKAKQPIAQQQQTIVAKLQELQQCNVQIAQTQNEMLQLETNIATENKKADTLTQEIAQQQNILADYKTQLNTQQQKVDAFGISQLKQKAKELSEQKDQLQKAVLIAQERNTCLQSIDDYAKSVINATELIGINTQQLQEAKSQLQSANQQKEKTQQQLQKYQSLAAENITKLREALLPNAECPVCGSVNHPFASHNPLANVLLAELALDAQQADANAIEASNSVASIQQTLHHTHAHIVTIKVAIDSEKTKLQHSAIDWQNGISALAIQANTEHEIHAQLQEKVTQNTKEISEATSLVLQYENEIISLEKIKEAIQPIEKWVIETEKQLTVLQSTIKIWKQQLQGSMQAEAKWQQASINTTAFLQQYFTDAAWVENFNINPEEFLQKITSFAKNWNEKNEAISLQQNELGKKQIEHTNIIELQTNAKQKLEQLKDNKNNLQATITTIQQQRNAIFEGKPIAEVEEQLLENISKYKNETSNIAHQKSVVDASLHSLDGELKTSLALKENEENDCNDLLQQIEEWLQHFNTNNTAQITLQRLQTLIAKSEQELQQQQSIVDQINTAILQAQTIVAEKNKAITEHQASLIDATPLQELQTQLIAINDQLKKDSTQIAEIDLLLKQDAENKIRLADVIEKINTQQIITNHWIVLDNLIGGSDAKKFRKYAQQYTLEWLLQHANLHLQTLNKRYVLQSIPNTLALQVMDTDMGDEVRSVLSLSGGESFLVSLALALGLASISSRTLQVESLFIDEGFGSLDPNTLEIAMDALERLNESGRKVGVISHVQEMKDRIPVQVQVQKMNSGKSVVQVVG